MPWVFVLIWSTGFVVARLGMPHAPPLHFLCWRYALSVVCLGLWMRCANLPWSVSPQQWPHLAVCGVLMHAGYLGGVWFAVKGGLSPGMAALIVGLQPVLTAVWVAWSGSHRVAGRQWLGLMLGLGGVTLVVWHKLGVAAGLHAEVLWAIVLALASITAGTLYQKRFVEPSDWRCANLLQLAAALAVSLPIALFEDGVMQWHAELIGALAWSVLILTLAGSSLLMLLIHRGAATQVTSLMYLVPPTTALMAWMLFGEAITLTVLIGMALCAAGVLLVMQASSQAAVLPQGP